MFPVEFHWIRLVFNISSQIRNYSLNCASICDSFIFCFLLRSFGCSFSSVLKSLQIRLRFLCFSRRYQNRINSFPWIKTSFHYLFLRKFQIEIECHQQLGVKEEHHPFSQNCHFTNYILPWLPKQQQKLPWSLMTSRILMHFELTWLQRQGWAYLLHQQKD